MNSRSYSPPSSWRISSLQCPPSLCTRLRFLAVPFGWRTKILPICYTSKCDRLSVLALFQHPQLRLRVAAGVVFTCGYAIIGSGLETHASSQSGNCVRLRVGHLYRRIARLTALTTTERRQIEQRIEHRKGLYLVVQNQSRVWVSNSRAWFAGLKSGPFVIFYQKK